MRTKKSRAQQPVTRNEEIDVVIVGAGVAGAALATRLAGDGLGVLILERTAVHVDRIRGEWLAPWGVREAAELGVLDVLVAAGGHFVSRTVRYGEGRTIEQARAQAVELTALVPDAPGVMMLGHPRICDALDQAAQAAGATLLRAVGAVSVEPGQRPTICFEHQGERQTIRPCLVVGADGRGSTVARQIGARVQSDPIHHLIAGLLIEGVHAWPEDEQTMGVHGGAFLLVFPQRQGRMRLYQCYPREEHARFAGLLAAKNFLAAFRVPSLPHADHVAGGRIAGPCQGYLNADTWVDESVASGVVLIGDAAGHNDPTIGQGLSLAMRDARLVAKALVGPPDGDQDRLLGYADERRERMRRLRLAGRVASKLRCEFGMKADLRRGDVATRVAKDPAAAQPLLVPMVFLTRRSRRQRWQGSPVRAEA